MNRVNRLRPPTRSPNPYTVDPITGMRGIDHANRVSEIGCGLKRDEHQ